MGVGYSEVANYTNTSSGTASGVTSYGGVGGVDEINSFFSALNWFSKGEPGAWYDPSDLTTLFQDSAGTIPVTAVEQPVGLMLDKSKGLALGAELVTNGGFATNTGWGGGGWSAVNGEAVISSPTSGAGPYQTNASYTGGAYRISFTVSAILPSTVVSVSLGIGSPTISNSFTASTVGTYSFTSSNNSADTYLRIYALGTNTSVTVDNISVKQIAGNHAFQGDLTTGAAAKRPMLSARVNLYALSEGLSAFAANFVTPAYNSAVSPSGTMTATILTPTNVSTRHEISAGNIGINNATVSVFVKANGYSIVAIRESGNTGTSAVFDLTSGTPLGLYQAGAITVSSPTCTPVGNGWFRISAIFSGTGNYAFTFNVLSTWTSGDPNTAVFTGDGTSGIFICKVDARPTNSGALLPPYQRVNTASDYDTVGFPLYLKANGTSSAMSTNSIDFTATDKMTVVTGVRKLSDATGVILEESPVTDLSHGGFIIHATNSPAGGYVIGCSSSNSGVQFSGISASIYIAPINSVVSALYDLSKSTTLGVITPKVNGTIPTKTLTGNTPVIGVFGNYPLYLFARNNTSLFLNGQFYGAIIRGAQSDTASVTQTENYMATKTGITF